MMQNRYHRRPPFNINTYSLVDLAFAFVFQLTLALFATALFLGLLFPFLFFAQLTLEGLDGSRLHFRELALLP